MLETDRGTLVGGDRLTWGPSPPDALEAIF